MKDYLVLVVEDDMPQALVIKRLIEKSGADLVSVDIADSLEAARRLMAVKEYGAVSLDLGLSDSTGTMTFQAIRAISSAYIVVFSGQEKELQKVFALHDERAVVIRKPDSVSAARHIMDQVATESVAGALLFGAAG